MLSSLTDLGGNSMMYSGVLFHCPNKNPFFSERDLLSCSIRPVAPEARVLKALGHVLFLWPLPMSPAFHFKGI